MTFGTMEVIQTVTVGSGGQATIEFTNIPATYDDLLLKVSLRDNGTADANALSGCYLRFNSTTTNYSYRRLYGTGASAASDTSTSGIEIIYNSSRTGTDIQTTNFGNGEAYIPNYRSSTNKSVSVDSVMENNRTTAFQMFHAGLWSPSPAAAITSIQLVPGFYGGGTSFVQHSTATLYGITRVPAGAKATGGVIYDDANYWYHVFTSSGTFTPSQSLSCDVLVIAGGGGGGRFFAGGGGAGGLILHSNQSLSANSSQTVTIGAGGSGNTTTTAGSSMLGTAGANSQFGTLTAATGGGYGAGGNTVGVAGGSGGSGGGAGGYGGTGGSPTSGQGSAGGNGNASGGGGGGGGAGGVGANSSGNNSAGAGGVGTSTYSSWGLATQTGQNSSGTYYYAGGGGGSGGNAPAGGLGGGGAGASDAVNSVAGTANTGGGGGGGSFASSTNYYGANGGSGIVIVRYTK